MTDEEKEVFRIMCSAIGVSVKEMAIALGVTPDDLETWLRDEGTEYYAIYHKEAILRKSRILNAIMDAAERDSPEAQKMALRIIERRDTEWQRNSS